MKKAGEDGAHERTGIGAVWGDAGKNKWLVSVDSQLVPESSDQDADFQARGSDLCFGSSGALGLWSTGRPA